MARCLTCDQPATHHLELVGYAKVRGVRVVRGLAGKSNHLRTGYCLDCAKERAAKARK